MGRHFSKGLWILLATGLAAVGSANSSRVFDIQTAGQHVNDFMNGVTVLGSKNLEDETALIFRFNGQWTSFGHQFPTPQNWSGNDGYSLVLENQESYPVSIGIRFDNNPSYTSFTGTIVELAPNEKVRILFDTSMFEPKVVGMQGGIPAMNKFYRYAAPWHRLDMLTVSRWMIYNRGHGTVRVAISSIDAYQYDSAMANITDRYGQFTRRTWAGKVQTDADLVAQRQAEQADLDAHPGNPDLRGSRHIQRQPPSPTRRWMVDRTPGGKAYFRHPNGRVFWSFGVTTVGVGAPTIIQDREHMFAELPAQNSPLAMFYSSINRNGSSKTTFLFYAANLHRKYGADWWAQHRATSARRIPSWGMNTLGCNSHPEILKEANIPFVLQLSTADFPVKVTTDTGSRIVDPFAADFLSWATARFTTDLGEFNGDHNMIGVMVDGETPWTHKDGTDAGNYRLALGVLKESAASPAKNAFIDQLIGTYGTIQNFNHHWGRNFASWTAARNSWSVSGNLNAQQLFDLSRFTVLYSSMYYSKVKTALQNARCSGLYLGGRECLNLTPDEVFRSAGIYCDVISVNIYQVAEKSPWAMLNSLDKPVLISEFSFLARDRGNHGASRFAPWIDSPNGATRAAMAREFMDAALASPNVIGVHWFTYTDQPNTGRMWDEENYPFGLVDTTDRPYPEMVDMFRNFADGMYQRRGA
jgi:hypothetical protein